MKKITKRKVREFSLDMLYDIVGSILYAIGFYTFAKSGHFAPGGVSGLSLIINHLSGIPMGTASLILNIPIILISYRVVGKKFILRSLRTLLISTFFLDVVFPYVPMYEGSSLLAALFTGVFAGGGLALVYMRGSSTGGADFLIMSVRKKMPHLSVGQISMFIDAFVILLGGLVYRNIDALLYGIITTYATSVVVDKIMYGAGSGKLAIIITTDGMDVAAAIDRATERGATLIKAIGTYSESERHVILCACSKSEIFKVREAAHSVDDDAFVMVTEANEVFGEGFKPTEIEEK